jgi:Flp pilus assembly protein CpaB
MARMRLLIIFAILIVLVAVVVAVVLPSLNRPAPQVSQTSGQQAVQQPQNQSTPLPTATPLEIVEIVIAVQDLPRGFRIPPNAVTLGPYPKDLAPFNAITSLEDVVGKIARTDIYREQPILSNLVVEDLTDIARVGSDAAAILPSNLVAVSIPVDRITDVAYAIQDGDRVDIIMSMLFVDVDEIFQSIVPNSLTLFTIKEDGTINFLEAIEGRPDTTTLGPVIVGPSERQRPRLVTQRTIQDAFVVHVGNFPPNGRFIGVPPTPTPVPQTADQQQTGQNTPPPPTATPARPDIITLGVPPQDAVVLTWAVEAHLPITMALRSANDTSRVPTDPVTLDYIMNQFNISLPVRRPYTIEPAIRSIRQLIAGDQIALSDATS